LLYIFRHFHGAAHAKERSAMHGAVLALIALLAFSDPAPGLRISGRLTSSLYTYEGQQTTTSTATYARAYQGFGLDLGRLAVPDLSFHTYAQGTTDLSESADSDPRLRLYQAHLSWKKPAYTLDLGRQRVYGGAGYGSIDGLSLRAERAGLDLLAYAGILVPLDKGAEMGTWSEGHLWGARLHTGRFWGTEVSLSFASREREPEAPAAPGQYSQVQAEPGAVVRRLASLDAERRFAGGHSLYARLDYDLRDEKLRRSEASGLYVFSPRLSGRLEWFRRAPAIFSGSLFSAFPQEDYQEIAGRLHYRLKENLQLSARFAQVLYEGDSAQRLGLVATIGEYYSLGYYRAMGYSRAGDGLVGHVNYPLAPRLFVRGELDLAAHERYEEAEERDGLLTGALGLTYRPGRRTFVELGVQGLRNPLYASDIRLFLRASQGFFRGEK
jgi:hypothetical protein